MYPYIIKYINFYSGYELKKEREARIYDAAGAGFPIFIGLGCGKRKTLGITSDSMGVRVFLVFVLVFRC